MNTMPLNRRPIFDAVRLLLARSFTQAEVEMLDRAIDRALGAAGEANSRKLGSLSERFESGGRGPGTVSGGVGDPGGVSYGTYQLSSRTGTAARFMDNEGAAWALDFGKAAPGSAAFSQCWREVAEREPDGFGQAQHAFIERTHYRPAVAKVLEQTGLDLDARHPAVRDAAWSVAVQHGGAAGILVDAVRAVEGWPRPMIAMPSIAPCSRRSMISAAPMCCALQTAPTRLRLAPCALSRAIAIPPSLKRRWRCWTRRLPDRGLVRSTSARH